MLPEHKQLKLTNGDELICEVIEKDVDMLVRNAMKLMPMEDQANIRYYSFRPWMLLQHHEDAVQLIHSHHIVGEATPTAKMMEQYKYIMEEFKADEAADDEEIEFEFDHDEEELPPETPIVH